MIRADEIHARVDWPSILVQLGVPETALRNKHGPCPACGGVDRFRFDHNKRGKGSFFCGHYGSGDGFRLLEHMHGWGFREARQRVIEVAHLDNITDKPRRTAAVNPPLADRPPSLARPTTRVLRLRSGLCAVANCPDAVAYLESRGLWPLPDGCTLRAHPTVEYFEEGRPVGRHPALVADVVDLAGELVTAHVTYLEGGKKLTTREPRKILSPLTGRTGCAVRLMPAAEVLGIAEGLETALSATVLDGVPVWSALNAGLLAKFEPPLGVTHLRIYADRDDAGRDAALRLMERLQGRVQLEVRIPPAPSKDFNDVLMARITGGTHVQRHASFAGRLARSRGGASTRCLRGCPEGPRRVLSDR